MTDLFGDVVEMPVRKTADISDCGTFRYRLTRYWGPGHMLPFVMLNPSTADATLDDPTIRRCMGFARREGAGGVVVANLCAFRSPSPADLDKALDPFGPGNQQVLERIALEAVAHQMPVVCAWGTHGAGRGDGYAVKLFLAKGSRLVCLGKTTDGYPRHPLYVKGDQPLIPFVIEPPPSGTEDDMSPRRAGSHTQSKKRSNTSRRVASSALRRAMSFSGSSTRSTRDG